MEGLMGKHSTRPVRRYSIVVSGRLMIFYCSQKNKLLGNQIEANPIVMIYLALTCKECLLLREDMIVTYVHSFYTLTVSSENMLLYFFYFFFFFLAPYTHTKMEYFLMNCAFKILAGIPTEKGPLGRARSR